MVDEMETKNTGVFATKDQFQKIKDNFNLAFNTPIMSTLPNGKIPMPKEDFRDMANRFASESGLPDGDYGVDPETLEFIQIF